MAKYIGQRTALPYNSSPSFTDLIGDGIINDDGLTQQQAAAIFESLNQTGDELVEFALTESDNQYTKEDMIKYLVGGILIGIVLSKFVKTKK